MSESNDQLQNFNGPFATDVQLGLSKYSKSIPSYWLYDNEGSRLFSEITRLDEYDLTRKETAILQAHAKDIAELLISAETSSTGSLQNRAWRVVELGAGDGSKTLILLKALVAAGLNTEYWPIDVSSSALDILCRRMLETIPQLICKPTVGDNLQGLSHLASDRGDARLLVLDLGSSIGNRSHEAVKKTLAEVRSLLREGDCALTGFDLVRDSRALLAAYDDSRGITKEFNLNLLRRMNRELGADFDLNSFRHEATWNPSLSGTLGGMESWLISLKEQVVSIKATGQSYHFRKWEPMQTEISLKFHAEEIERLAELNSYTSLAFYKDEADTFVDVLWKAKGRPN